jgi:hypothetical protein
VSDQETSERRDEEDVELHKKRGGVLAQGNEEAPTEGSAGDDDVELHGRRSGTSKL